MFWLVMRGRLYVVVVELRLRGEPAAEKAPTRSYLDIRDVSTSVELERVDSVVVGHSKGRREVLETWRKNGNIYPAKRDSPE